MHLCLAYYILPVSWFTVQLRACTYCETCRSLNKKESQLYAPLANIGAVRMDQDAMYIDIGRANYTRKELLVEEQGKDVEDDASSGGEGDVDDESEVWRGGEGTGTAIGH